MDRCNLCSSQLAPKIAESAYWLLVLNHNQNLLGKCFWVLRRHLETISELTPAEWADLHREIVQATRALVSLFQPDHFNYAFLQNQDRHVHLHIIPRYAQPRAFAGLTFDDPDYPGHYAVSSTARHLATEQYTLLVEALRNSFVK